MLKTAHVPCWDHIKNPKLNTQNVIRQKPMAPPKTTRHDTDDLEPTDTSGTNMPNEEEIHTTHAHTHTHIYIYIYIYVCMHAYIGSNRAYA